MSSWTGQARGDHQPVALVVEVGDPAPGLAEGVTFASLGVPTINAVGELAFFATITGPGVTDASDETIWAGLPDDLRLVAREGDPAPQTEPGTTFFRFYGPVDDVPVLAATGKLAFEAWLSSPGTFAVYVHDLESGDLEIVIRDGDPTPNVPGVSFEDFGPWTYNDAGLAVFATLVGPGITGSNSEGLWTGTPDGLTKLLRAGDISPGYADGVVSSFALTNLTTNPSGETAFIANVSRPAPALSPWVLYAGVPGSLAKIAAAYDPSPIADCEFYTTSQGANTTARSIGESGTVTFYANIRCGNPVTGFRSGVFQGGPGGLQTVATKEDPVGFGGATWSSLWEYPVGGGDMLAVGGRLAGGSVDFTNNQVVYGGTAGSLGLFARKGDPAPGTASLFSDLDPPQVDASGRIALRAVLDTGERGIWAGMPGDVELVAIGGHTYGYGSRRRTLDASIFGPSGFEPLAPYGTGNADGLPSAISDDGPIAFRSYAAPDGEAPRYGIYLPEPSGALPLAAAVALLGLLARAFPRRARIRGPHAGLVEAESSTPAS